MSRRCLHHAIGRMLVDISKDGDKRILSSGRSGELVVTDDDQELSPTRQRDVQQGRFPEESNLPLGVRADYRIDDDVRLTSLEGSDRGYLDVNGVPLRSRCCDCQLDLLH